MHILLTDACKIFMMSATNCCCGQVAIFACRFLQISAKISISKCLDFSSVNNFILFHIVHRYIFLKFLHHYKIVFKKTFEDENNSNKGLFTSTSQTWLYLSEFSHYICLYQNRNYTTNA